MKLLLFDAIAVDFPALELGPLAACDARRATMAFQYGAPILRGPWEHPEGTDMGFGLVIHRGDVLVAW